MYKEYALVSRELEEIKKQRKAKEEARLAELEKNLKKYPDALKKYEASQVKAEKERDEKEIVLERRIRYCFVSSPEFVVFSEIQEYFGYWMDPKDPRLVFTVPIFK